ASWVEFSFGKCCIPPRRVRYLNMATRRGKRFGPGRRGFPVNSDCPAIRRQKLVAAFAAGMFLVAASARAVPQAETSAGWVKPRANPVLGGKLGTCFDVSLLKEGGKFRMWFTWQPKASIALDESRD